MVVWTNYIVHTSVTYFACKLYSNRYGLIMESYIIGELESEWSLNELHFREVVTYYM